MILLMQLAFVDERTGQVHKMLRFQSNSQNMVKINQYADTIITEFQRL